MKRISFLFTAVSILVMAGCADPLEQRKTEEVGAQLQRGVTGQGRIGTIDRSNDPYVKQRDAGSTGD